MYPAISIVGEVLTVSSIEIKKTSGFEWL
jgi:hypothetical protein